MSTYSVYVLACGDGSYYTGIATDIERRLGEHRDGTRGAKYLRGRGPLRVVFSAAVGNRSAASKVEFRIKQLSRLQKQRLIDGDLALADLMQDHLLEAS